MLGPIDHVYYWVSDMDRAVKFYEGTLGLTIKRREGSNWTEIDGGAIHFALHGAVDARPVQTGGATVSFEVKDLDRTRTELEGRGVELDHVGEIGESARYATFRDPDGNTLQIIEYQQTDGGWA